MFARRRRRESAIILSFVDGFGFVRSFVRSPSYLHRIPVKYCEAVDATQPRSSTLPKVTVELGLLCGSQIKARYGQYGWVALSVSFLLALLSTPPTFLIVSPQSSHWNQTMLPSFSNEPLLVLAPAPPTRLGSLSSSSPLLSLSVAAAVKVCRPFFLKRSRRPLRINLRIFVCEEEEDQRY